jgi:ArsR family transcriptional regulator
MPARPLPDQLLELIAYRFRVLSDPTRIRLLGLLDEGEASVQELTDQIQTTHQNVSKHLGVLYQCGMVARRKEGNAVRYSLVDWTGWWLVGQVAQGIDREVDELRDLVRGEDACPRSSLDAGERSRPSRACAGRAARRPSPAV